MGANPGRGVVFVGRTNDDAATKGLLRRLSRRALDAGLDVGSYASTSTTFRGEQPLRSIGVMEPGDATGLYRGAHRRPTFVVALSDIYVRRDPRYWPLHRRGAIDLESFVAHKAFFALVVDEETFGTRLLEFGEWASSEHCGGRDDPRVLPLHVFETNRDWKGLGDASIDAEFRRRHKGPKARTDASGKTWMRAPEEHGQPVLRVGNVALPAGLHWHVTADGAPHVTTTDEVWRLARRDSSAYLNVYPNAHVQHTGRASGAKRVFPRR